MYAARNLMNRTLMNLLRWHDNMCCMTRMNSLKASQSIMYKNPCLDLQEYLHIPIFKSEENCFNPSIKNMQSAQELFVPAQHHVIQRIAKAVNPEKYPDHDLPEIALLGRVNAGKSSLLKAVLPTIPDIKLKVSKVPGRTQSLNFYQVGNSLCLVDMPGYGFRAPRFFKESAINYLKNRQNLIKTFLLIDATEGFHSWDDAAMQMLGDLKISFAIVLTKIDAISNAQRLKSFLHVQSIRNHQYQHICFPQIFMLSSHSSEGMAYFIAFLAHITGNLKFETS